MLEQVGRIKSGEIGQLHTEFRHDATVAATLQLAAVLRAGSLGASRQRRVAGGANSVGTTWIWLHPWVDFPNSTPGPMPRRPPGRSLAVSASPGGITDHG